MNRKIVRVIVPILILAELSFCFLAYMSYQNKDIDKVKEISKVDKEKFAMYKQNESGGYDEITDSNVFPEGYTLNTDKSNCVDSNGNAISNILSWSNNKLTITSNKTAYCYLYFDIAVDIKINVSTEGESGVVPTSGIYTSTISCDSATATYDNKYQRVKLDSVTSDEVKCNLDFVKDTTTYTALKSEVESKATSISLTNNVGTTETSNRYTGKQPDNWIWFNNEMWRIIGSIPVCLDSSCSSKENLVKIIRSESIGGLAFDGVASNTTWGTNTLYDLLNNYYYGKKDATGASPCLGYSTTSYALCNYTEDGISSDSTDYYGRMAKEVYWNVGTISSASTTISASYGLETATVSSVSGRIGLMSASDYGYATSEITYSSIGLSSLGGYEQNNWLYGQGYEWIITPASTSNVMALDYSGNGATSIATGGLVVRPVVYLDSSVYIVSGDGSISNPYQIVK